jgi:predicted metal-binding protein
MRSGERAHGRAAGAYRENTNPSSQIPLKTEAVRKIPHEPEPARLAADLEMLRDRALTAGAAEASIIDASRVVFDPAVTGRVVAATGYASYHWPLSFPKDSIEEAVAAFQKGILFRMTVAGTGETFPEYMGGKTFPEYMGGPIADAGHRDLYYRVYEVTAAVESAAFYSGYHLAMGLAVGNCRAVFCAREPGCPAMTKGRTCLHPYKARPSLEAAGINARQMARELGWQEVPDDETGFLVGLVLVY